MSGARLMSVCVLIAIIVEVRCAARFGEAV